MKKYYSMEVNKEDTDVYIFGNITAHPWREKERDAYSIVKELAEIETKHISVHINSCGGDVSEGLAIYNTLRNHKASVTTYCDGFACSAASVIFMAGDRRVMNEASLLLIHNPSTYGYGDANAMEKCAEDLRKITKASLAAYMTNVNITEDELKQKMDVETWITADEAVVDGFATEIMTEVKEGITQSAMNVIQNRLLNEGEIKTAEIIDVDMLAEKIAEKLKNEKVHDDRTEFSSFFNSKKGDKK